MKAQEQDKTQTTGVQNAEESTKKIHMWNKWNHM